MQIKDLLDVIGKNNSKKPEIFNHSADLLMIGIRNSLEGIYEAGAWGQMVDVTQFGIPIRKISSDFRKFEFDIVGGYLMRWGQTLHKTYEMPTMQEYVDQEDFVGEEINGFYNQDILQLIPLYEALKGKGIECYVDRDNAQLVVAIDVK